MSRNPSRRLLAQLKTGLGRSKVLDAWIDRMALSSDASFYLKIPEVVVRPSTIHDIQILFEIANETDAPLTFRAAGTSLSGQSITDGILVDLSRGWRHIEVQSEGDLVQVQPGAVGSWVNDSLRSYHRKMGPDPASINAAMMGGILANNASGMCCGVVHNAYHTLHDITAVLPNGFVFSPGEADAEEKFRIRHPEILNGIIALRNRILQNEELKGRIKKKYKIKNTIGYSLNAFLDYTSPLDILAHLLIGSEGTLGFIACATLRTIPAPAFKLTGLLFFKNAGDAGAAVSHLLDAAAVELMDYSSLQSIKSKVGPLEKFISALDHEAACLLIEYEFNTKNEMNFNREKILRKLNSLPLIREPGLTDQASEQSLYWSIRKGLYPAIGSLRPAGTSALIEDVAVPVERLADLTVELQMLFKKHGYREAILFGHAKDGNLHFVITPSFSSSEEIKKYENLMSDITDIVVHKFDGSLKGEHGTGRNMAPFVAMEWGVEAYEIMKELKRLLDPKNICNPGVILNDDPLAHIKDLKNIPIVNSLMDLCIECGYCESKCPSRDLTLTPRQRIVVKRRMEELRQKITPGLSKFERKNITHDLKKIEASYEYSGIDTCAADGLCALSCPVNIDTGIYIKKLRQSRHTPFAVKTSLRIVDLFHQIELSLRWTIRIIRFFHASRTVSRITKSMQIFFKGLPFYPQRATAPSAIQTAGTYPVSDIATLPVTGYDYLYFQTCLSRNLGAYPHQKDSIADALIALASRAGLKLKTTNCEGYCCGMPFQSKGYDEAYRKAINITMDMLYQKSDRGKLPIVVDTSPCTLTFIQEIQAIRDIRKNQSEQPEETQDPAGSDDGDHGRLHFIDSVEFAAENILPRLQIHRKKKEIAIHPVCSIRKMDLTASLKKIGEACAERVTIPDHAGCCGMAGDRGLVFPELTSKATEMEMLELKNGADRRICEGYYSSSHMCEEGLFEAGRQNWISFLYLIKEASE